MNYYREEYEATSNPLEKRLLSLADELLTFYMSNEADVRLKSLEKTDEYLNALREYVDKTNDDSAVISGIKEALRGEFPRNKSIFYIEAYLAVKRIEYFWRGEKIEDFGVEHNAMFVVFTLISLGISKKSIFTQAIKEYIRSPERTFPYDKQGIYEGRKRLFYRNAYRAEMYSHRFYTDLNPEGMYDMYTPLVLTRMATEQYLKYMYEKHIGGEAPPTPAECRIALRENGIISRYYARELWAALERGNANTHQGESNYAFANLHGIRLLKKCFDEMN